MKEFLLKRKVFFIFGSLFGLIFGLTLVTYAGTYNSEEISYDTSASGAVQSNVKDALDFLYNKTKSGASSECSENMSCVEKPGVTMNVSGPGSVDKGTVYVGLNESNTFTVTPNSGYTLASISCTNGYTLGSFKTMSTEAMSKQNITITNPGTTSGASCTITFSTNEISVASNYNSFVNDSGITLRIDSCNSNSSGCICYQIAHNIKNFTYGSHTGCNFKSTACYLGAGYIDNCQLEWRSLNNTWGQGQGHYNYKYCTGVITCAT